MKNKLLSVISVLLVLCTLSSCASKDIVKSSEISKNITQTTVVLNNHLQENADFGTYLKNFNSSYIVPGLLEGVIPQGICYDETTGYLLITGYYEDEKYPSVVMALNEADGKFIGAYFLKTIEGKDYFGHVGGIASSQNTVYITSNGECFTFPANLLINKSNYSTIQFQSHFKLNTAGSFACFYNNVLWVGDFVESDDKVKESITDISTLETGETFYAYCEGYTLVDGLPNIKKINSESNGYIPDYFIAIPEQVQGMAFTKTGKIMFSTSYGRKNNSKIYIYEDFLSQEKYSTKIINGSEVDFYACSNTHLHSEIIAPPMAEGLANHPDKIYIVFESGAEKYRCGGGKHPTDTLYYTTFE